MGQSCSLPALLNGSTLSSGVFDRDSLQRFKIGLDRLSWISEGNICVSMKNGLNSVFFQRSNRKKKASHYTQIYTQTDPFSLDSSA